MSLSSIFQRLSRIEYLLDLLSGKSGGAPANTNAPGTPAYNPAWYAKTDVYWDPVGGSDSNSGNLGSPVLTWAEIVRRYGSITPEFNPGQSVTFHKLSGQPNPLTDPVFFAPYISDGARAILLDTPVVVATVAAGTVTPRNRSAGTLLHIANMPAGTAKNQLVFNSTRGSYAFIDSMAGSTAFMQQPIVASIVNTVGIPAVSTEAGEDNTWTTGDTLVLMQCQALNLKLWAPAGGDVSSGGQVCAGWVQFARIVDTSGTNVSSYSFLGQACNVLSMCQIDTRISAADLCGRGGLFLVGCTVANRLTAQCGTAQVFAGGYAVGITVLGGEFGLNGDAVTHTSVLFAAGQVALQSFYSDTALVGNQISIQGCVVSCETVGAAIWGPGNMTVGTLGAFQVTQLPGNDFTDALLITGVLSFQALTVGWTPQGNNNQGGTFTLNGTSQVTVTTGPGASFPPTAPIVLSLATVGSTPGVAAPYFSAAQIQGSFFVKSPTASCNDVYNWQAMPAPVALTPANMSAYHGLYDPASGARFCITN